jgi:hypothetical protein
MFGWGCIIFIGLWLIFSDMKPVAKAKLAGNPMVVHALVLGSGFWLHGGSADGAMAAVMSGVFSALYFRIQRKLYGCIKNGVWHPGSLRKLDPRKDAA